MGGDVDIVRKILEAAVIDINVQDASGLTPLLWAVHSECFDLVETLLSAGADVEILSNTGRNAFHYSVNRNDEDSKMTRLLCDHVTRHSFLPLYARDYEKKTPMYYAVKRGQLRTVQMFLDAGFDVNHKEINSKSLLHISVEFFGFLLSPEYLRESSNFAMTKMLLDNGADCNATDHKNCTPLHYAVSSIDDLREFHPTLLLLLGHHVDLDLRGVINAFNGPNGEEPIYGSALNLALRRRKPDFAGLLVRYGSHPDSVISEDPRIRAGYVSYIPGEDAITQSMSLGSTDLCKLLHAAGANTRRLLTKIGERAASSPDPEMEALEASIRRPLSLTALCRLTVRRTLRDFRPESLKSLGIPQELEDYLRFSEFSHIWEK